MSLCLHGLLTLSSLTRCCLVGALDMAARARSEPQGRSRWLLETARSEPQWLSKWLLEPDLGAAGSLEMVARARLGAAGALEMAARARLGAAGALETAVEPASEPQGRSKSLLRLLGLAGAL